MPKGVYEVPLPSNEPVLSYAPGSEEKEALKAAVKQMRKTEIDAPMYIGSEEVRTGNKIRMSPPYEHKHTLGHFHEGDASQLKLAQASLAPSAALTANSTWE
ncbi:MAG: 1-pyrroline-5-carboxylate dehydrogenase, partial [Cyclobacteriaceae bacterium]